jgi:ABC-2 type transport system permease protein
MNNFRAALWAEGRKARRSLVPWLAALGMTLVPLVGGLFMVILQNPERAKTLGLISAKAQLTAGVADWPTYVGLLAQAMAVGGALVFALVTAWLFGREFTDHTAKELLALPTARASIVGAKFVVLALWVACLTVLILGSGLAIGTALSLPGWSTALFWRGIGTVVGAALLTLALMSPVAFLASLGRGYLAPLGWAILTLVFAQILAAMGWGSWFPWTVPALFSELAGPRAQELGLHSYVAVALASAAGLAGTFWWWSSADQTH